jgi:hypothetical protein
MVTFATFEVVNEVNVRVFETILKVFDALTLHTKYVPFAVHPLVEVKFELTSVMGVPERIP